MEDVILSKLDELRNITMLGVKEALTLEDCSLFTGLSKSTIYKLCGAKKIPFWKSQGGKLTFFSKDELTAWMLNRRVKTVDEVESEAANYLVSKGKKMG